MYQRNYPFYHSPYCRQQDYPFPPVDFTLFEQSLLAYQTLMQHGNIVINYLTSSTDIMYQLMYAAQASDFDEVDRIIRASGVPTIVDTSFTPTGVTFTLFADAPGVPRCCTLTMQLRWG